MEHVMDADAIRAFLEKGFPQAKDFGRIVGLGDEQLTFELDTEERHLRPGGTVSGPVMMTMVDTAAYYLVLSLLGPVGLAVTTSLHIDFLRKPTPGTLLAEAELLKLGKRLAVVSVAISRDGERFAQASVTYSLPPR
ncbi:MAG: PaaI family thioesterase [Polyangiales bacterium]